MAAQCRSQVSVRLALAVLLSLTLVVSPGCRAKDDVAAQQAVTDTINSHPEVLPLLNTGNAETLATTVTGRESFTCTAALRTEAPSERPCRRFSIVARQRGTLVVRLQWDNGLPLLLAITAADGVPIRTGCCRSPQSLTVAVEAGAAYELQIMLVTAWGRDEHQPFELTTSFAF
jgi:hypothetical protein